MKTYAQEGDSILYTNAGQTTLTAGSVVVIGGLLGVLINDVAAGATGMAMVEGVHAGLPKVSGAVIAAGERVLWDVSAGAFDDAAATPASGDVSGAATAWEAAGNGVATVAVKLNGFGGTVT